MRRYVLSLLSERVRPTGVGTYGREVARAMGPLLAPDERLVVVRHRDFPGCESHASIEERALVFPAGRTVLRRAAEQTLLPALAMRSRANLVHAFNYALPSVWGGSTVLSLMEDRAYLERAGGGLLDRAVARAFKRSVRGATALTAISHHGATRCARTFDLDPSRIAVAPPGVDLAAFCSTDAARDLVRARLALSSRPIVLFVGEVEPHKNVLRLIGAFERVARRDPAPLLVVAGGRGAELSAARERARDLGDRVRWSGYLPREELAALLSASTALVLPSLDEGFGMPVVEAFAAGVPVLASTAGALPETTGGAALLVHPTDEGAIAAGLERLLTEPELRSELVARGRTRAAGFTWKAAAQAVLDVYRQVAASGVAPRGHAR